jgi:COP9 signalosome complex subunit 1
MRQDSSHPEHIIEVSRHLISVSMARNDWASVQSNIQKIQAVHQSPEAEKETQPYIKSCLGLSHLHQYKYRDAAGAFLAVEPGMNPFSSTVMSPNDVAAYGAICALATMDRDELQRRVLDNSSFRSYLELEPPLRRAITFFVNSRYSACLAILESYRNDFLLDLHLTWHVQDLFHRIRSKSIIQYFIPFSCVTLDSMDAAFAAPGKSIENELLSMITDGSLDARIDTQNRACIQPSS